MKHDIFFQFALAAPNPNINYPPKAFLILTIPAAIIGFCALIIVIIQFVKMFHRAEVCRFPLRETSEAEINQTGEMDVCLEVPMMKIRVGDGLDYELFNKRDGRKIELHRTAAEMMNRNNGVRRTVIVRKCEIEEIGTYQLRVSGINSPTDYSNYALTLATPTALKSLFYVLGIVFTALLFVGGFVCSIIIANAPK